MFMSVTGETFHGVLVFLDGGGGAYSCVHALAVKPLTTHRREDGQLFKQDFTMPSYFLLCQGAPQLLFPQPIYIISRLFRPLLS